MIYAISGSHSTGDLAAAEATGAHVDMLRSTVYNSLDALDVGLPGTVGTSVGMADLNTECHAFFAKFALCHFQLHLPADKIILK